jgi:hypothetical protein
VSSPLREQVDVIVYGSVDLDLVAQIHGIQAISGPLPFTATAEHPHLGQPVASDDITGGPGSPPSSASSRTAGS